jgi:hypothetical protein
MSAWLRVDLQGLTGDVFRCGPKEVRGRQDLAIPHILQVAFKSSSFRNRHRLDRMYLRPVQLIEYRRVQPTRPIHNIMRRHIMIRLKQTPAAHQLQSHTNIRCKNTLTKRSHCAPTLPGGSPRVVQCVTRIDRGSPTRLSPPSHRKLSNASYWGDGHWYPRARPEETNATQAVRSGCGWRIGEQRATYG